MPLAKEVKPVKFEIYVGKASRDAVDLYCTVCGIFARNILVTQATKLRRSHAALHPEFKRDTNIWKAETYTSKVVYSSDIKAE